MIVSITAELISAVTGVPSRDFQHLRALDLHLKDLDLSHQQEDEEGSASPSQATPKIRKIESLHLVANLRQLNLGYNAITRIEGLSALSQLVELNLAENAIRKIENLDGLKSLERLNLSGNQIERIPEMMKSLHRLTHFRIARNQLTHIGDLTHLASLDKLTNLRIDDNPISELEHIMVYTVFHIPSLIYLDGVEISDKLRDQGRKKYAGDQLSSLKSKLNAEQHRLQRLRRELQSGPEAHFVMQAGHQSLTLSRPQQVQLDDANRILAMKLDEVKRVESEIHRLTEVLQRMNSSSTGSPSHIRSNEVAYSSPEADEYESESFEASRSFVNPNKATPFASSSTAAFNANKSTSSTVDQSKLASSTTDKMFRSPLPAADNIAGKKLVDLNDKVEKLAAKVLTSEKEKQVLKTQLDQQKSSSETVQRLRNELEECEMQLEQALHAAKQSNDEANDLQKDNDRLQASLQENRQQLQSKQREVDVLQSELISMRQESNELRRLVRENKQVGDVLRKSSTQNISSYSLMDEMRTQDLRIQAMNQKLSMDEMQSLNERLSRELESYILQTNTLNTTLLRCREENDHLKGRLQVVEQGHHERESHVIMLESEQRRLQQSNDELRHQQASMLKEKENLLMKMSVLETDLQSLLYAKRKTPQKSNTPARQYTLNVPPQQEHHQDSNGVRNNNYFEQASMDSDYEGLDFPSTATAAARIHQHQQQRRNGGASTTSTTAQLAPTTKFAISALERSAAEIIAHLILEEMQQSKTMSMGTSMKEACVRAALRLVHTSSIVSNDLLMEAAMDDEGGMAEEKSNLRTPTRGGGGVLHKKQKSLQVPMTPFHALGDRAVLSKLVADTHAGLVAIEDSNLLKEEMRQLQKLLRELEDKISSTEQSLVAKEIDRKQLERHAEDARKQAEHCLTELEQLQKKLQSGREDLLRLDAEDNILKREVEVSRTHLSECLALTDIEQKNLSQLRERYMSLKQDYQDVEKSIAHVKDQQLKEEQKLHSIKSSFSEKLRLLQSEKSTFEQECKSLQHLYEELRRRYQLQQEEMTLQQRDQDHQLSLQRKVVDEESHKSQVLNNEIRLLKYDVETLSQRKSSLEHDVQHLQDILQRDEQSYQQDENDRKQRVVLLQKQLHGLEDQVQKSKTRVYQVEQESQQLTRRVDELKQLQIQLEEQHRQKQKLYEETSLSLQQQEEHRQQALQRIHTVMEDKQHQVEVIKAEIRMLEKKREDMKVSIQSYDLQMKEVTEALRIHQQDKDKVDEDLRLQQQRLDDLKTSHQHLKLQYQVDLQQQEDLHQQVLHKQQEYHVLQQREDVLKANLMKLKSEGEEQSQNLTSLRLSNERESRQYAELTSKKIALELETQRMEDLLQQLKTRQQQEAHKQQELEAYIRQGMEEFNRIEKKIMSTTQQMEVWKRKEEDHVLQELQWKQKQSKLQLEIEHLHTQCQQEQARYQQLREASQQCQLTLSQQQDSLSQLESQIVAKRQEMEGINMQYQHVERIKSQMEKEVQKHQDIQRQEVKRLDKLESTYTDVEKQLKSLRGELTSAEKEYEALRHLTLEESRKVEQQKRIFHVTVDELNRLEAAIQESHVQLDEEKRRAVDELGKLEQAKRSAHAHMFLVNEAHKRLGASKDIPLSSTIASSNRRYPSPTTTSRTNISHVNNVSTSIPTTFRTGSNAASRKLSSQEYSDDDEQSDSSSVSGAPPMTSLQKAVENLRMQSSAALASAQMT